MYGLRWIATILLASSASAIGQWQMEHLNSTADLRGIDSVGGGVAWASGTNGTVLRTEDGGYVWQSCSMPPGAEKLDFRGIQGFDAGTAIVMSSGPGDLSRVYKTTDGCHSWKQVFTNPDTPDGFFDAILFLDRRHGVLFGDPAPAHANNPTQGPGDFRVRVTRDGGVTWVPVSQADGKKPGTGLHAFAQEGAFAASNSSIASSQGWFWLATSGARVYARRLYEGAHAPESLFQNAFCAGQIDLLSQMCGLPWTDFRDTILPMAHDSASSGIFSLFFRSALAGVAVGGDYQKPNQAVSNAAFTPDGGETWQAAQTKPHGYRSSVAYDAATKTWVTVGPNGTDISTDDGKNWRAVKPDAALHEAADADRNWNAISLPFAVGPHGRIGKLDAAAIKR